MALAPGGIFKSYPEHALINTLKQAAVSLLAWTSILTASPTLNF